MFLDKCLLLFISTCVSKYKYVVTIKEGNSSFAMTWVLRSNTLLFWKKSQVMQFSSTYLLVLGFMGIYFQFVDNSRILTIFLIYFLRIFLLHVKSIKIFKTLEVCFDWAHFLGLPMILSIIFLWVMLRLCEIECGSYSCYLLVTHQWWVVWIRW